MTEEKITWRKEVEEYLGDYWELKGRPDLFNDVVDHVLNVYPENNFDYTGHYLGFQDKAEEELVILGEAFAFLQTHCTSAVSSKDLEFMADEERRKNEQSL